MCVRVMSPEARKRRYHTAARKLIEAMRVLAKASRVLLGVMGVLVTAFVLATVAVGQNLELDENDPSVWEPKASVLEQLTYGQVEDLATFVDDPDLGRFYLMQFDELNPHHRAAVLLLRRQINAFFENHAVRIKRKGSSAVTCGFDADQQSPVNFKKDPMAGWNANWSARVLYDAEFFLLTRTDLSAEADEASGSLKNGVWTSPLAGKCYVYFNFWADTKTLMVSLVDRDRDVAGPVVLPMKYNVQFRQRVATSSSSTGGSAKFDKDGISGSVSSSVAKKIRVMEGTVIGSNAISEFFLFRCLQTRNLDGTAEIVFVIDSTFSTTTDLTFGQESVAVSEAECSSKKRLDVTFSWKDALFGIDDFQRSSECAAGSSSAPASIRWWCQSLVDGDPGMVSSARIVCYSDGLGGGHSFYQPAFGSFIGFLLKVDSPAGAINIPTPRSTKFGLTSPRKVWYKRSL